jgi:hypothetical protein
MVLLLAITSPMNRSWPSLTNTSISALTLTSSWASVLAHNSQGGVQVLAAFVTEVGGLRSHLEQQVIPWLRNHARFAFSNRQNLCGCYSDDSMDLLTLRLWF